MSLVLVIIVYCLQFLVAESYKRIEATYCGAVDVPGPHGAGDTCITYNYTNTRALYTQFDKSLHRLIQYVITCRYESSE